MAVAQPKKPQTSFFLYLAEVRSSIQAELKTKNLGPVAKEASSRWKALAADKKQKFEKIAEEAKAQYTKDMEAFKEAGGEAGKDRKDKKDAKAARHAKAEKKEANKDKPKKPQTSFFLYLAEVRSSIQADLKTKNLGPVAKEASSRWKSLAADKKQKFEKIAEEAKAKYEEELKVWKESTAVVPDAAGPSTEQSPAKSSPAKAKGAAKKRPETEETAGTPPAKKAKGRPAKGAKAVPDSPVVDASVLQQAVSLKMDGALKNLVTRPEMKHIPHDKMLSALQSSGGLVNKAKASLLGA